MLLGLSWYHYILSIMFAFVAVILMGVILLQRGRGVGLAGAFGGAGGNTAFGAKTGDVLTWLTMIIAAILLILACLLNYVFVPLKSPFVAPTAITAPTGAGADAGVDATPPAGATPASPPAATPASPPAARPEPKPAEPAAPAPSPANPPAEKPAAPPAEKPAETPGGSPS